MSERTVLLYGQSLLLSLVGTSLSQNAELHVVRAVTPAEVDVLTAHAVPDVLVYDISFAPDSHALSLLFRNPRLLLIGLDPETNRAVVLTGKQAHSLTLEQMREIVEAS